MEAGERARLFWVGGWEPRSADGGGRDRSDRLDDEVQAGRSTKGSLDGNRDDSPRRHAGQRRADEGQFYPRVLLWGARAAYVGPGLNLDPHHNAAATIAIALDRPFESLVIGGPAETTLETLVIIPPNTPHHLRAQGPVAFVYLDASGRVASARSAIRTMLAAGSGPRRDHIRHILSALRIVTREDID